MRRQLLNFTGLCIDQMPTREKRGNVFWSQCEYKATPLPLIWTGLALDGADLFTQRSIVSSNWLIASDFLWGNSNIWGMTIEKIWLRSIVWGIRWDALMSEKENIFYLFFLVEVYGVCNAISMLLSLNVSVKVSLNIFISVSLFAWK